MKPGQIRELTDEELQLKHDELQSEYFGLRVKHALGQLENPLRLRDIRRDIARARTLLHERGIDMSAWRRRHTTAGAAAGKQGD